MIYLTRRYRFSASHRLHNETLTAEENQRLKSAAARLMLAQFRILTSEF